METINGKQVIRKTGASAHFDDTCRLCVFYPKCTVTVSSNLCPETTYFIEAPVDLSSDKNTLRSLAEKIQHAMDDGDEDRACELIREYANGLQNAKPTNANPEATDAENLTARATVAEMGTMTRYRE